MLYLLFSEGYAASGGAAHIRVPLCKEAIRLARLLLRLFPAEPEIMGLTALLLLQHARAAAEQRSICSRSACVDVAGSAFSRRSEPRRIKGALDRPWACV